MQRDGDRIVSLHSHSPQLSMMTAEQLTMVTTGVSRRSKVTNCTIIIIIIIILCTCIIILSSMRSGSVGIAGHLGPIPPAAGKTPRDHLQFEATPSSPLPFLGGLNWPHSSLIALHASDLRPPNRTVAKLPLSPVLRLRSISSSQEFTFSAFVALLFLFPIAIVSPWFFAIPCFAAVLEADGGW